MTVRFHMEIVLTVSNVTVANERGAARAAAMRIGAP